ncbi:hypothetical protein LB505_006226 [Fusarium chuoi]|nr:hypothetical protein LB505_006226 [Fusarium chuoi]
MAISARKRFWEAAASVDPSESTKTESSDLAQIDAIRELVQAACRRVGTYGPDFASVATKLYKLEMTLRRLRDEVAEEQDELPSRTGILPSNGSILYLIRIMRRR